MQWAELHKSRRFFDLFLRLVDNGTLDEAHGPIAENSTFWDMLYGLDEKPPRMDPGGSWPTGSAGAWCRLSDRLAQQAE